jgi:CHAD domain-containing protein
MVSKVSLHNYFLSNCNGLKKCLRAYAGSRQQESLHKLRLHAKKIAALFFLVRKCSPASELSEHRIIIRQILKDAGKIRDLFMIMNISSSYGMINSINRQRQEQEMADLSANFIAYLPVYFEKINNLQHISVHLFSDIPDKVILKVFRQQLGKLNKSFVYISFSSKLHQSRKKIKRLLYIYPVLHYSLSKQLSIKIKYLDHLQNAIGQWHDAQLTGKLLKTTGETKNIVLLQINQKNKELKNEIKNLLNGFNRKVSGKL